MNVATRPAHRKLYVNTYLKEPDYILITNLMH